MHTSRLRSLLGCLLVLGGIGGCNNHGDVALQQNDASDFAESTEKFAAIEQPVVESDPVPTPAVSTVSLELPAKPSLITLPKGSDLSAQMDDASGPVLLDFFADWCGPCRAQSQILHEVEATAAESQTLIIKIDVDQHPQLAKKFQVSSLPTLLMIQDGEVVKRQSGLAKKSDLVNWMQGSQR